MARFLVGRASGQPRVTPWKSLVAVLVLKVLDDSPAEKANMKPGDVLQEVENRTVTSPSQVQEIVQSSYLFLPIEIQLNRSGENINLSLQPECCMTLEE